MNQTQNTIVVTKADGIPVDTDLFRDIHLSTLFDVCDENFLGEFESKQSCSDVIYAFDDAEIYQKFHLTMMHHFEFSKLLIRDEPSKIFQAFSLVAPILELIFVKAILHIIYRLNLIEPHLFFIAIYYITWLFKSHGPSNIQFFVFLSNFLLSFFIGNFN